MKEQAIRTIYSVTGKCRKFDFTFDMQMELFNATVLLVLAYGSEVWEHYIMRELELLHLKFLKHLLLVYKNTSNDVVSWERTY